MWMINLLPAGLESIWEAMRIFTSIMNGLTAGVLSWFFIEQFGLEEKILSALEKKNAKGI